MIGALKANPIRIIIAAIIVAELTLANVAPGVKVAAVNQVIVATLTAFLGELGRSQVIPVTKAASYQDDLTHILAVLDAVLEAQATPPPMPAPKFNPQAQRMILKE